MSTILTINASARSNNSYSRDLVDYFVEHLTKSHDDHVVIERDVAKGLPFVDEKWVTANFTDEADRTDEQKTHLALSDQLISEIEQSDVLIFGIPIYNFGLPATLKSWIDLVARARKTFKYTENGPQGLLTGKKAYIIIASGGTAIGSDIDFVSGYMKHILGFLGITDVTIIPADQLMAEDEAKITAAKETIIQTIAA